MTKMNDDLNAVLNKLHAYLTKHKREENTNEFEHRNPELPRNKYEAYLNATRNLIDLNEKHFHQHLENCIELNESLKKSLSKLDKSPEVILFCFFLRKIN